MTLPLTKEIIAAAYEYSRATPPFCKWRLPPAEMVNFVISNSPKHFAQYWWDGRDNIEISAKAIGYTPLLIEKLQHEMNHMRLRMIGQESKKGGPSVHNAAFRKNAASICKVHGWDPKAFY